MMPFSRRPALAIATTTTTNNKKNSEEETNILAHSQRARNVHKNIIYGSFYVRNYSWNDTQKKKRGTANNRKCDDLCVRLLLFIYFVCAFFSLQKHQQQIQLWMFFLSYQNHNINVIWIISLLYQIKLCKPLTFRFLPFQEQWYKID